MNNDYRSPSFKKWLDKLQQESWQLELIISGFAIYALILAYEPISINISEAMNSQQTIKMILWFIVFISWAIFIFNLTLHIVLRGLWIGALGLRYVSGDIDYHKLNYSKKFTKHLKKRVGTFDRYIARLEKYCSILFAISFLVFFYILGFFTILLTLTGLSYFVTEVLNLKGILKKAIGLCMVILFGMGILLTFIDFITMGYLKKNKYISLVYYPFYRLFTYLTLSFLYRPLVYNFLDNKFGRRLSLMLLPSYLAIIFFSTLYYQNSNYILKTDISSEVYSYQNHYEDLLIEKTDFGKIVTIPSKIIRTPYLQIFLYYTEQIEDHVFESNKNLKPKEDLRSFKSDFVNINIETNNKKDLRLDYLKTLNEIYSIRIDSSKYKADFTISTNSKERLGFETYLNIRDLNEGKHILRILAPPADSTKVENDTLVTIPFWHFKD
ncbi:hypothetical protein [Cellulophaga sp. Z1A5H]|uniref:hypothetical protein n=1 Tax=Cellulophaga sp. Z1A5H TaxID=2687291 RepID=UPI0013FDB5C6|nr:hypothetical protein [Cellulophaga sp. Z1A5H]